MIIETRAYARAAILGNPSDGYFGKTVSLIVKNFGAYIQLYQTPELVIEQQTEDSNQFKNIYKLRDQINLTGYHGGVPLVKAAIKKFCEFCDKQGITLPNKNFTVRYSSSIPRQVGLSGSSAIIIATLRALSEFYKVEIPKVTFPSLALAVETEELGITAGLQDRVIQVYEGLVYMDFDKDYLQQQGHGIYEPLDPALLPSLFIAYKTELGKVSGKVLNNIRSRYEKGDEFVINTLADIADLAEQGKQALLNGDHKLLHELMNENFDQRCKIMNISDSNKELVNVARACGASAKFTGSGGSIIGVYYGDEMLNCLVRDFKKIKARVIRPTVE
ncbi:mevalonate kinase [Pontibacter silvestris]|uniref:Mevalonate kinase n=1 Tax=Pontibacter silvestris TaxID=2305183 RepID=A0ABW4X073_9BACT|nr:GHMP kinase [Pontibacter silvestris]MCC9135310.1 GHMP kinase [Pontibacter silvestris]